jgi:hypothetical protein
MPPDNSTYAMRKFGCGGSPKCGIDSGASNNGECAMKMSQSSTRPGPHRCPSNESRDGIADSSTWQPRHDPRRLCVKRRGFGLQAAVRFAADFSLGVGVTEPSLHPPRWPTSAGSAIPSRGAETEVALA